MRKTSYTVLDLMSQLRAKGIFDLREVAYAILETNGSMSVLLSGAADAPTRADLDLKKREVGLSEMLVLDGELCKKELSLLHISPDWVEQRVRALGASGVSEVLYLQRAFDGTLSMQKKEARHVQ